MTMMPTEYCMATFNNATHACIQTLSTQNYYTAEFLNVTKFGNVVLNRDLSCGKTYLHIHRACTITSLLYWKKWCH